MVSSIGMLLEILLTGYLLFNYKKLVGILHNKSFLILIIIAIRNLFNYKNINFQILMTIDILYIIFLLYLFYVINKKGNEI